MIRARTKTPHQTKQFFVPCNKKIADITETDTNKYTLDLATALSETRKIIALQIYAARIAGAGVLSAYPNEGAIGLEVTHNYYAKFIVIADGTQRLQYSLSVADDDFDLYCFGYIVEA